MAQPSPVAAPSLRVDHERPGGTKGFRRGGEESRYSIEDRTYFRMVSLTNIPV